MDGSEDHLVTPEAFPEEYHLLMKESQLPESYSEESLAEHQQGQEDIRQMDDEVDREISGAAAETDSMAAEEPQHNDSDSPELDRLGESGASSGNDSDQGVYDFRRVIGIKKFGTTQRWLVEWYPEDYSEFDEPTDWVQLPEEAKAQHSVEVLLLLAPGATVSIKWRASAANVAREPTAEIIGSSPSHPSLSGWYVVKYLEDNTMETVNLLHPEAKRPLWRLVSAAPEEATPKAAGSKTPEPEPEYMYLTEDSGECDFYYYVRVIKTFIGFEKGETLNLVS